MKRIIITLPEIFPNEIEALMALAANGAEIIHLRKPDAADSDICALLDRMAELGGAELLSRITLHYHDAVAEKYPLGGVHRRFDGLRNVENVRKSCSCHTWHEVEAAHGVADYVFLSPIFNSVSKAGYNAAFSEEDLRQWLTIAHRPEVVALGGITSENISKVKNMGFDGAAILGSVWAVKDGLIDIEKTIKNWNKIKNA